MSTTEKTPASPDHGGQNTDPESAGKRFKDPTPTAPLELPVKPPRSLSELMKNRAVRAAAAVVGFATAMGLVVAGANRTEAIAGIPVGPGHSGDPTASGPLVPGAEKPGSPEVVTGNLCDQVPLDKLAEWIMNSPYALPKREEITCRGDMPVGTAEEVIAAGTWIMPQGAQYKAYPNISIFVMKDQLPDGGSAFDQNRRTYTEAPHTRMVGGTEVTAMSSWGHTLVRVPQPDGSALDLRFSAELPAGMGSDSDPYPYFHKGELNALPDLLPMLGLVREN